MTLPPIQYLINRCKALATLDLILSPDWQYRYYSYNSKWSGAEQMASMRNGSGDEWWIVFHQDGWAALKGLDHESTAWSKHSQRLATALQRVVPASLTGFSTEPAFRWDATSFCYFHPVGAQIWTRGNDLTPYSKVEAGEDRLLALVNGQPADYVKFASDYYEVTVDVRVVIDVFRLLPVTTSTVTALNPSTTLEEISDELFGEIGYLVPP